MIIQRVPAESSPSAPPVVSFVAPTSNTGRTSVVANLSRILSQTGLRVLVLDWGTEGSLIHDYLRPFHTDELSLTAALGPEFTHLLRQLADERGTAATPFRLRRYASGPGRLDVVGVSDPVHASPAGQADRVDPAGIDQLYQWLRRAPYDYVLLDSPTDLDTTGVADVALLSDQVVVCFTPQSNVVGSAADLATRIRDAARLGVRVVVLASQLAEDDSAQADRIVGEIRHRFAEFLNTRDAAPLVKIPIQPYDEVLATLREDPSGDSPVLAAYRELTRVVTGGAVDELPVTPSTLRRRYHAALIPGRAAKERILLACDPTDRWCAEFVRDQLAPNGIQAEWLAASDGAQTTGPGEHALMVIVSPQWERSADASAIRAGAAGGSGTETVVVHLGGTLPAWLTPSAVVDLTGDPSAETAALRLFGALGIRTTARPAAQRGRLPAATESLRHPVAHGNPLPPRDPTYFGRYGELTRLRDRLLSRDGVAVVLLHGDAGAGKTALAREYEQCFARDYDTIWWIPAHDRRSLHSALVALGEELGVKPGGDIIASTLAHLASPTSGAGQWLLVYDGADDPAVLDAVLPVSGAGHVIVTSRAAGTAPSDEQPAVAVDAVGLGALPRDEAVAGLRQLGSGFTDHPTHIGTDQAQRLVDRVGGLPIVLRMVAMYLTQKAARLLPDMTGVEPDEDFARVALDRAVDALLAELPTGTLAHALDHLVDLVDLVVGLLIQDEYGPRALCLAEMLTFLAPDGVDPSLLRSPAMLGQLAQAARLGPRTEVTAQDIDRTLWTGVRYGLLNLWWTAAEPVRMPPVLQTAIRDRMASDERELRQAQVIRGLAGFAQSMPAASPAASHATMRAELQRHLLPSGALYCTEWDAREWVVGQFQYLFATGDPANHRYAVPLVQQTLERWRSGDTRTDRLTLLLGIQRTNLSRVLGRHAAALDLDNDLLATFTPALHRDHPAILVLRRGTASDLRGLGEFEEALALDEATWRMFVSTHGEDHPQSLITAHNLAVSQFLTGDVRGALEREQDTYQRRRRVLGENAHSTLWSATEIGVYQRELGQYDQAIRQLRDTEDRLKELRPDSRDPERLRIRRHLAVTLRLTNRTGAPTVTNIGTLTVANIQVCAAYRDILGPDHPLTWATTLSSAADHFAAGDVPTAVQLATDSLDFYTRTHGTNHPFTAAAQLNLATYEAAAGQVEQAGGHSQAALDTLLGRLGEAHPWTIAALVDHAGIQAAGADPTAAVATAERAYSLGLEFLGHDHPYTATAQRWTDQLQAATRPPSSAAAPHWIDITIPET